MSVTELHHRLAIKKTIKKTSKTTCMCMKWLVDFFVICISITSTTSKKLSLQYKTINSANIKKLSQYRYWLSFSDIGLAF
jgi:hypothetical protein